MVHGLRQDNLSREMGVNVRPQVTRMKEKIPADDKKPSDKAQGTGQTL